MSSIISSEILKKLWKSRNIMLEILLYRGYPVEDSDYMEYEDFLEKTKTKEEDEILKSMILEYERTLTDKIIVVWLSETSTKVIRDIQADMTLSKVNRAILVTGNKLSAASKGYITSLSLKNILINVYPLEEAQYNIMKHELVPTHRICSTSKKRKILEGYSVDEDQIPYIKFSDPVIRHIGAIHGQLIEITRNSDTAEGMDSITYRIVSRFPPTNKNNQLKSPIASQWVGPGGLCWQ